MADTPSRPQRLAVAGRLENNLKCELSDLALNDARLSGVKSIDAQPPS